MTPFHFLQEVIWAENAAFFGQEYFSAFLQDKSVQKSLSSCWTWVNTFNVTEPTDTINVWLNCSGRELPSFQSSSVCFFVVATNWNLSRDLIFLSALESVKFNENKTPYFIEHFRLLWPKRTMCTLRHLRHNVWTFFSVTCLEEHWWFMIYVCLSPL